MTKKQRLIHTNWWSAVVKLIVNHNKTIDEAINLVPKPKYK